MANRFWRVPACAHPMDAVAAEVRLAAGAHSVRRVFRDVRRLQRFLFSRCRQR